MIAEKRRPQPVPLPIQLTESTDLSTRELACAAQRYGKAAQLDSEDFDTVYNHGLALQELALRATTSRQEQLDPSPTGNLFSLKCFPFWLIITREMVLQ